MTQLSDDDRRALAQQVNATFADPNADSATVLEAYLGYMVLNEMMFYTASGELGVHLSAAVAALRDNPAKTPRRFLGMPNDNTEQ